MSEYICGITTGDTDDHVFASHIWMSFATQPVVFDGVTATIEQVKGYIKTTNFCDAEEAYIRLVKNGIVIATSNTVSLDAETTKWYTFTLVESVTVDLNDIVTIQPKTVSGLAIWRAQSTSYSELYQYWGTIYDPKPEKPVNPSPIDTANDVILDQETISWESGSGEGAPEEVYNVYYGESGDLSLVSEEQAGLSFTILDIDLGSPFNYKDSRSWRIDAVNEYGTTTGDTWSFTSLGFDPPLPHYTLIADPPDFTYGDGVNYGGTEGVDWYWDGYNFIRTSRKLVAAAKDTIWYEEQV